MKTALVLGFSVILLGIGSGLPVLHQAYATDAGANPLEESLPAYPSLNNDGDGGAASKGSGGEGSTLKEDVKGSLAFGTKFVGVNLARTLLLSISERSDSFIIGYISEGSLKVGVANAVPPTIMTTFDAIAKVASYNKWNGPSEALEKLRTKYTVAILSGDHLNLLYQQGKLGAVVAVVAKVSGDVFQMIPCLVGSKIESYFLKYLEKHFAVEVAPSLGAGFAALTGWAVSDAIFSKQLNDIEGQLGSLQDQNSNYLYGQTIDPPKHIRYFSGLTPTFGMFAAGASGYILGGPGGAVLAAIMFIERMAIQIQDLKTYEYALYDHICSRVDLVSGYDPTTEVESMSMCAAVRSMQSGLAGGQEIDRVRECFSQRLKDDRLNKKFYGKCDGSKNELELSAYNLYRYFRDRCGSHLNEGGCAGLSDTELQKVFRVIVRTKAQQLGIRREITDQEIERIVSRRNALPGLDLSPSQVNDRWYCKDNPDVCQDPTVLELLNPVYPTGYFNAVKTGIERVMPGLRQMNPQTFDSMAVSIYGTMVDEDRKIKAGK